MGTRCYVGLENSDGKVEYIEFFFDGYFSSMVPFLKNYKTREEVKKMIDEEEKEKHTERSIYALSLHYRVSYIYIFAKEGNWICHKTLPYFDMDELKY